MSRKNRILCIALAAAFGATSGLPLTAIAGDHHHHHHGSKPTSSLKKSLELRDEAMFFVNGALITSNFPSAGNGTTPPNPATFAVNQMYVHYRSPK